MADLNTIFSWFEAGDYPTEAQFKEAFSSFFHKDTGVPMGKVEGLELTLGSFASSEAFTGHLNDPKPHKDSLALLDASNLNEEAVAAWKDKLGVDSTATIDENEDDTSGNVYTKPQINAFVDELKEMDKDLAIEVDHIKELLLSNDLNLDELQEIVDYVKDNRSQIEALQALIIGATEDTKVSLTGDYAELGNGIEKQSDLNTIVKTKILSYDESFEKLESLNVGQKRAEILASQEVFHNWNTMDVMVQVYDSVNGYTIECEQIRNINGVQINFLNDLEHPAIVLMNKITNQNTTL